MSVKRVLQVISSLHTGGAETMIMNVYREIDTSKLQFDFLVFGESEGFYEKEVIRRGARVFRIKSISATGVIRFIINIIKIIKTFGPYQAVHAHTDYQTGLVAFAARVSGVSIRICHSHNAGALDSQGKLINSFVLNLLRYLIKIFATHLVACGKKASQFMFCSSDWDKVVIFRNAINIQAFSTPLSESSKTIYRERYMISNSSIVIGHVGRFSEQKNHKRLLEIFQQALKINDNCILFLVGEGKLRRDIEEYAERLGIIDKIRFLGLIPDVYNIIKLFNVLLMPSFFEGVPLTLVEAQAAGIPCVVSDPIPKEVDLDTGLMKFVSLQKSDIEWAKIVLCSATYSNSNYYQIKNALEEKGYSIEKNINILYRIYNIKEV